jgi:pilus assembly protein CpaB
VQISKKPYLLFGLAAVFGLFAAVQATRWIAERAAQADQARETGRPVVIAAVDIPFGTKLAAEHLTLAHWPADHAPPDSFASVEQVVGRFANQRLAPGEAILPQRAVELGGGSSLSMQIEPTKRAVSVRVNDVIGVGGFLLPGNRVDVLATRMTDERRAVTRTLLQNLKVLAVDQTASAEKDRPAVVRAVTLEMEPAEAELLVGATEEGTVQLALRNPDDITVIRAATPVVTKPAAPRPQKLAAAPAAPPPKPEVVVIRQAQVGTIEVNP